MLRNPLKAHAFTETFHCALEKSHFDSETTSLGGLGVPLRKAVLGCIVISRNHVLPIGSVFKGHLHLLRVSSVCVFSKLFTFATLA